MKKFSFLFLMAIGLFAFGTMTSCTDSIDDLRNDLYAQNRDLERTLDEVIQSKIDSLGQVVNNLRQCECEIKVGEDVRQEITKYFKDMGYANLSTLIGDNLANHINQTVKNNFGTYFNEALGNEGSTKNVKEAIDDVIANYLTTHDIGNTTVVYGDTVINVTNNYITNIDTTVNVYNQTINYGDTIYNVYGDTLIYNTYVTENNQYITNIVQYDTIAIDADEVNRLIDSYVNSEAFASTITNWFTAYGLTKNTIHDIDSVIVDLKNDLAAYDAALKSGLNDANDRIDSLGNVVSGQGASLATTIVKLDSFIVATNANLSTVQTLVGNNATAIANNTTAIGNNTTAIGNLQNDINSLRTSVNGDVKNLRDSLVTLYAKVKSNDTYARLYINVLKTSTQNNKTAIEELQQKLAAAEGNITDALTAAKAYTDQSITALRGGFTGTLKDLNDAIATAEQNLQDQIDSLCTVTADLGGRVDALETELDTQTKRLDKVYEALSKLITSINLEGASNSMLLGTTMSFPFDITSNILGCYYGEGTNDGVFFPTNIESDDEFEVYSGRKLYGSAGKLYFTINPGNTDFSGVPLTLVNSVGGLAGIELSNVKPSDKLLQFGITRSVENGLYEADAVLKDPEVAKLNVDKGDLKSIASSIKSLIKNRTGIRELVTSTSKTLYNAMTMPAYAIRAEYDRADGGKAYVHSKYGVATVAVKPLSYNANLQGVVDDLPRYHIPNLVQDLTDRLDQVLDDVKTTMYFEFAHANTLFTWNNTITYDFKDITLDNVDVSVTKDVTVNVTYTYDYPVFDADGKAVMVADPANPGQMIAKTEKKTGIVPVTIPVDAAATVDMSSVTDQVNAHIRAEINNMLAKVNAEIKTSIEQMNATANAEVNRVLEATANKINQQVGDAVQMIKDLYGGNKVQRISDLIDRINNVLDKIYSRLDNVNYYLQPMLFINDGTNTVGKMSNTAGIPTIVKAGNDRVIYPSSFFAETINPAYKKFIKVVEVTGGSPALCQEAMDHANAVDKWNTILDGSTKAVLFDTEAKFKGLTYKIAYAALDYSGYEVTQYYYIKAY